MTNSVEQSDSAIHKLWQRFLDIEGSFNNHFEAAIAKLDAIAEELTGQPRPEAPIISAPALVDEKGTNTTATREDTVTTNEPAVSTSSVNPQEPTPKVEG